MNTRKLMYYDNNPKQEQMAYLVWELINDKPNLMVICTTDNDLNRYINEKDKTLFVEKVLLDHYYGQNDMNLLFKLLHNKKD